MARRSAFAVLLVAAALGASALPAQEAVTSGIYRGVLPVVKFDVSPPLRELARHATPAQDEGLLMVDPENPLAGPPGPQDLTRWCRARRARC
jgi:hypothetical protein